MFNKNNYDVMKEALDAIPFKTKKDITTSINIFMDSKRDVWEKYDAISEYNADRFIEELLMDDFEDDDFDVLSEAWYDSPYERNNRPTYKPTNIQSEALAKVNEKRKASGKRPLPINTPDLKIYSELSTPDKMKFYNSLPETSKRQLEAYRKVSNKKIAYSKKLQEKQRREGVPMGSSIKPVKIPYKDDYDTNNLTHRMAFDPWNDTIESLGKGISNTAKEIKWTALATKEVLADIYRKYYNMGVKANKLIGDEYEPMKDPNSLRPKKKKKKITKEDINELNVMKKAKDIAEGAKDIAKDFAEGTKKIATRDDKIGEAGKTLGKVTEEGIKTGKSWWNKLWEADSAAVSKSVEKSAKGASNIIKGVFDAIHRLLGPSIKAINEHILLSPEKLSKIQDKSDRFWRSIVSLCAALLIVGITAKAVNWMFRFVKASLAALYKTLNSVTFNALDKAKNAIYGKESDKPIPYNGPRFKFNQMIKSFDEEARAAAAGGFKGMPRPLEMAFEDPEYNGVIEKSVSTFYSNGKKAIIASLQKVKAMDISNEEKLKMYKKITTQLKRYDDTYVQLREYLKEKREKENK